MLYPGAPAVTYPSPGRDGFRDFVAPGHRGSGGRRQDGQGQFKLQLESVNSTGWAALRKRLARTDAHVLLAQETWVPQTLIPEASEWARKRGWKSVWAPARLTEAGGTSGGVAIFARDFLGLRHPDVGSHIWCPSRAVAAVLEAPGHRPMVVASTYLIAGCGPAQANLEVLADVGRAVARLGDDWQVVVAGD